jgi:hypothetical protein
MESRVDHVPYFVARSFFAELKVETVKEKAAKN